MKTAADATTHIKREKLTDGMVPPLRFGMPSMIGPKSVFGQAGKSQDDPPAYVWVPMRAQEF